MIEIRNLSHYFGEKQVLDNVNLDINEGSVMGLVGINGAGKTTLLRLASGVYVPKQGSVLIDGERLTEESAKRKLFFLPDDPYYTLYSSGKSLFDMYKVFYPNIDKKIFDEYLDSFGLQANKPLRNFSKGMKRQLYIALALAVNPKYLLLDEAFDGLDPLARLSFKKAINRAAEENGTSVLISSHSLRELEDFCDSYALIDNMTVSSSGDISERVDRYCKFQLAFSELPPDDAFEGLPIISLEKSGRFLKVVLEGRESEMQERLILLNPAVIEQMNMDFEEMFIHEVNSREHQKDEPAKKRGKRGAQK